MIFSHAQRGLTQVKTEDCIKGTVDTKVQGYVLLILVEEDYNATYSLTHALSGAPLFPACILAFLHAMAVEEPFQCLYIGDGAVAACTIDGDCGVPCIIQE